MKAFVITIKGHKGSEQVADRCIKTAARNGIKVEKFYGVTPKDKPGRIFEQEGLVSDYFAEKFSKAESAQAAFLSHYNLWKKCIDMNEPIIIFEHDAVVVAPLPSPFYFNKVITFSKPSYGFHRTPVIIGTGALAQKQYFGGAHGYAVKPQGAIELVESAVTNAGPTDVFLCLDNFPWLQEYYPWICEARDTFSTIQRTQGCVAKHCWNDQYKAAYD